MCRRRSTRRWRELTIARPSSIRIAGRRSSARADFVRAPRRASSSGWALKIYSTCSAERAHGSRPVIRLKYEKSEREYGTLMDDLLAVRSQMAMSLAFHIIFAVAGITTPLLMCIAEWRWLRTRDETYLTLAKRWAKGTAILFAVGAVSGTVLSFELGLLWPEFMRWAGPIIGMPFSLEGFAFFTEAIFLGIYLYGWERVSPRAHLAAGAIVALSGAASAIFVVIANAWMNTPAGFRMVGGKPVDIDPIAAMMNPAALGETIHMLLAAYAAVGFAVVGMPAFLLLRDRRNVFHRHALAIALAVGGLSGILQPLSGDLLGPMLAHC